MGGGLYEEFLGEWLFFGIGEVYLVKGVWWVEFEECGVYG